MMASFIAKNTVAERKSGGSPTACNGKAALIMEEAGSV